jgi:hypothetical protein
MMKKLLLMTAVSALALNANAQYKVANSGIQVNKAANASLVDAKVGIKATPTTPTTPTTPSGKGTAGGSRTYDYTNYIRSVNPGGPEQFGGALVNIWQDSMMRQFFTMDGLIRINFSSVAQTWSLQDVFFNDGNNPDMEGLIHLKEDKPYTVDSVSIMGFYVEGNGRSSSLVDTIDVTVAVQTTNRSYYWLRSNPDNPWVTNYLPSGRDTFWTSMPMEVDSVNLRVGSFPTTQPVVNFPIILTAAERVPDLTGDFNDFKAKLPTPLNVPAGGRVAVSYTFRSSDTWSIDDTVTSMTRFTPGFIFRQDGPSNSDRMDYFWYEDQRFDKNMSHIMFSNMPSRYISTHVIAGWNNPTQFFNQYLLNTISITCPTCELLSPVSINEKSIITSVSARPNPATAELNVPVLLNENANVKVTLINIMGQVVASQDLGQVNAGQQANATFNVSALSNGIYMCTVDANGQRVTERVSVAH